MWLADNWKDYEVLDCSEGEKLERWGKYRLLRPDPQVIWNTPKEPSLWGKLNAHYHRSTKGGGEWEFFDLPEQWSIGYRDLKFNLKPFSFKHTGLFPEQAVNWDWMRGILKEAISKNPGREFKVTRACFALLQRKQEEGQFIHINVIKGTFEEFPLCPVDLKGNMIV